MPGKCLIGNTALLDSALSADPVAPSYPPYNIEMLDENRYVISLAVASFEESELDIIVEKGVLTVPKGQENNNAPIRSRAMSLFRDRAFVFWENWGFNLLRYRISKARTITVRSVDAAIICSVLD